jgi:hypothetical protein
MSDFTTIAAELVTGVQNTHPNTTTLIKAAMVRQLANLQPEVIHFMETSGSFATVAGQTTYDGGTVGFPKSLLRFDHLYYDMGSYTRPIFIIDLPTVRDLQEQGQVAYPRRAAWFAEKLQFGPAPAGAYTVKWDAILDSQKDTATGALLTTASTTQTNGWFTTGVVPFKHLVWADYFGTSPDQRPELSSEHMQRAAVALGRLREAGKKRKAAGGVAVVPNAFDAYPAADLELARQLFPGAHI